VRQPPQIPPELAVRIPPESRPHLDELPVSVLAEYIGARLEIPSGRRELRLRFRDRRYDRHSFR
jgi:hypothetical protein